MFQSKQSGGKRFDLKLEHSQRLTALNLFGKGLLVDKELAYQPVRVGSIPTALVNLKFIATFYGMLSEVT